MKLSWDYLDTQTKQLIKNNKMNDLISLTIGEVILLDYIHGCKEASKVIGLRANYDDSSVLDLWKKLTYVVTRGKSDLSRPNKITPSTLERYLQTHFRESPQKPEKLPRALGHPVINSLSSSTIIPSYDALDANIQSMNGLELGSLVAIQVDTTPGVRGIHSVGVSRAKVIAVIPDTGKCLVVPMDGINVSVPREVSTSLLSPACSDGRDYLNFSESRNSSSLAREKESTRSRAWIRRDRKSIEESTS